MKDDGKHWPFDPKFKPLMTGPRNGPSDPNPGVRAGLPWNVEDELRIMAGYSEGQVTAGREFAVIARALLAIAMKLNRE